MSMYLMRKMEDAEKKGASVSETQEEGRKEGRKAIRPSSEPNRNGKELD